jgi:acylphosphatase
MLARKYLLEGRVQGVGFRYFVFRVAQSFGVLGWVKNLKNGMVEMHVQGDNETLMLFEAEIRSGPTFAIVENIQKEDIRIEDFKGFFIER